MTYFLQVVTVRATDPDDGKNAELVYMIPSGLADDLFSIDTHGVIRTTAALDREIKSSYTFSGQCISRPKFCGSI